jgi:undecaprenol kinase
MKTRIKRFHRSLTYAHSGLQHALATQPNLGIHLLVAATVSVAAFFLHFDYLEWSILVIAIGLVIVLEMLNTVAELVVDLASPEFSDLARTAKDVSAAAVLIAAVTSVIIGIFLFGSKF